VEHSLSIAAGVKEFEEKLTEHAGVFIASLFLCRDPRMKTTGRWWVFGSKGRDRFRPVRLSCQRTGQNRSLHSNQVFVLRGLGGLCARNHEVVNADRADY
jgi:hypothetical protein